MFAGTLALSWSTTAALRRISAVANIIGADRRPVIRAGASQRVPKPYAKRITDYI